MIQSSTVKSSKMNPKNGLGSESGSSFQVNHIDTRSTSNTENKNKGIEQLFEILKQEIRSAPPSKPVSNQISNRCLIRLHNCTPYGVTPFWIDHRGAVFEYPIVDSAGSLCLDTYVSHLWFFKIDRMESSASFKDDPQIEFRKILAVPEETLDLLCKENKLSTSFIDTNHQSYLDNNSDRCALCKHMKKYSPRDITQTTCSHFTGEAKFAHSDKCGQGLRPSYIYTCDDNTHMSVHATKRRNIYLVEPFLSLRERCFLTLEKHIDDIEIIRFGLPVSLQREYLRFITIVKKIDGNK